MFIELTGRDGGWRFLIAVDSIISVCAWKEGAAIEYGDHEIERTEESYEEVKRLIKQAIAGEY